MKSWVLAIFILSPLGFCQEVLDVNGLIIDKTISRFGKTFYIEYSQLIPVKNIKSNVVVEEKYMPRYGSIIVISINGKTLFSRILGRKSNQLSAIVRQASGVTLAFIARSMVEQGKLHEDPDLKGNGL